MNTAKQQALDEAMDKFQRELLKAKISELLEENHPAELAMEYAQEERQ